MLPAESRTCSERTSDELAVGEWYASHAAPLKSLTAGSGFDDLQPLKKALVGVRVVGLGEGTHGTHEFTTVRHRLFEFLVREMGFRYWAIEASYSAALKIDDYVQTGMGDPRALLWGIQSWPFMTSEMAAVITWMRTYNETAAPDQRLHFVGIDVQAGKEDYVRLEAFLAKVDPAYLQENGEFLRRVAEPGVQLRAQDQDVRDGELRRLQAIRDYLTAKEKAYAALSSPAEAHAAVLEARNLVGIYDVYVATSDLDSQAVAKRDRYMADMAMDLLDQAGPGARMVLIAHNGHVSKLHGWMGDHLRERLGDAYYAIELLFSQGTFRAMSGNMVQTFPITVGKATADHLEWQLDCAELSNAFVDYRHSPRARTVQRWLQAVHNQWVIGAMFDPSHPEYATGAISPLKWDGLIYIPESTPSHNT